jgi:hypothetical protein
LRAIAIGWAALPVDRQSDRDAGQFLVALAVSLGVMFPIINPLGHVPMFYVMTEQDSPAFRRLLAGISEASRRKDVALYVLDSHHLAAPRALRSLDSLSSPSESIWSSPASKTSSPQ